MKPSTIDFVDTGLTSANYTLNSTSYVDIPGVTTTYASGSTPERLFLWLSFMAQASSGNVGLHYLLNVNGVQIKPQYVTESSGPWRDHCRIFIADIPANTTVTIKAQGKVDGNSVLWGRDNQSPGQYLSRIQGFAISNA